MKRFAVIVTLACLIVAMTTGTAFARVCVDRACNDPMVCAPDTTIVCPMKSGPTMQHGGCDHRTQSQAREAVSVDHGQHLAALPAEPLSIASAQALLGQERSAFAPDARGAPHLTTVIRI